MIRLFKNLFLTNRFFALFGLVVGFLGLSFAFPPLLPIAQTMLVIGGVLVLVDLVLLFNPSFVIGCERDLPRVFSLGDENVVRINLDSSFSIPLTLRVIDELPIQFQKRDFELHLKLGPQEKKVASYFLRPVKRGEYVFNNVLIFAASFLGLVERRHLKKLKTTIPVYPSILQMKNLELKAFARISHFQGIKKIRRLGHSYEFEQIKNYVKGDDYRSVNWKATGRHNELMVNQYEDERAQQIYSVIDKSRSMKLPFNGLSLMDYAINASLVISNIALKKHDKAGLITFSDKIGTSLRAERSPKQLQKIIHALYKEKERPLESNYELLFRSCRNIIRGGRSLLFLYTNFESMYALERVLPLLRKMNAMHLLVVVFFENTEIKEFSEEESANLEEVYHRTIARKFIAEKEQIVHKLRQYGIQSILTRPEDLSLNTVNKYLELKARGMI
ncbi:MAG: DUF58 domain-containing protein [Bacteroidota bacterium]